MISRQALGIIAVDSPTPTNTHATNTLKVREKRKPILMPNHRAYNTCTKDPNGVLNIPQIHFLQSHIIFSNVMRYFQETSVLSSPNSFSIFCGSPEDSS